MNKFLNELITFIKSIAFGTLFGIGFYFFIHSFIVWRNTVGFTKDEIDDVSFWAALGYAVILAIGWLIGYFKDQPPKSNFD